MKAFDKRLTPARPDLAATHLRGLVEADCYVEGQRMRLRDAIADLRNAPRGDAGLDTQVLHGERLTFYDEQEGWAFVQLERDGYVGYVPINAIGEPGPAPSHRVCVPRTFIYPAANMKLAVLDALPMGAEVSIDGMIGDFAKLRGGLGCIYARHLAPIETSENDFVSVAESLLHAPYLWGGKSGLGVDCSGLVQISLHAAGIVAPRDTDMQEAALGAPLSVDAALQGLQRGDLIFWKGHVGIMQSETQLIHANGWHMQVASEPLHVARDRIAKNSFGAITSVKRI